MTFDLVIRGGTVAIAVGADADIAIWNPDRKVTLRNTHLHHNVDYTPYEGRVVTGWPETVLSRGEVIVSDGTLHAQPGRGRFLKQGASSALRNRGRGPAWNWG